MNTRWTRFPLLVVLIFFLGAGCASLLSGDATDVDTSEVEGTYTIQHFEFIPQASALDPINLLEHVEEEGRPLN